MSKVKTKHLPKYSLAVWVILCGFVPVLSLFLTSAEYWVDFVQIYPHFFLYPLLIGFWIPYFATPCYFFVYEHTQRKSIFFLVLLIAIIASGYTVYSDISEGDPAIWEIASFESLKTDIGARPVGEEMRYILEECPAIPISSQDSVVSGDSACDARRKDLRETVKAAYREGKKSIAHYSYVVSLFIQTLTISVSICALAFLLNFKLKTKLDTNRFEKFFSVVFFCYLLWMPFRIFALKEKSTLYQGATFFSEAAVIVVILMANFYLLVAAWKDGNDRLRILGFMLTGIVLISLATIFHDKALLIIGRHTSINTYPVIFFIFVLMFLPFIQSIDDAMSHKRVFLSYSRKDERFANKLKNYFKKNGISIRIDKDDMRPAQSIEEFVRESIKSTQVTVLILSKNSIISSWVAFEVRKLMEAEEWSEATSDFLIPCSIDSEFLDTEYSNELYELIEKKIVDMRDAISKRHERGRLTDDLSRELRRLEKMRGNLDTLLLRIRETNVVNFSEGGFQEKAAKLVDEISRRLNTL